MMAQKGIRGNAKRQEDQGGPKGKRKHSLAATGRHEDTEDEDSSSEEGGTTRVRLIE
jgi:hypothetical protein